MLQKRKNLLMLAAALLIVAGAVAFYQMTSGVPGKLYRFYPANSSFYMELAPGEKLAKRFIAYLKEQDRKEKFFSDDQQDALDHQAERARQAEAKGLAALREKRPGEDSEHAMQESHGDFRKVFLKKYNTTFEPYLSMGTWPERGHSDGHMLVVLPLKEDMDIPEILKRFELSESDFEQHISGKLNYYVEKDSQSGLAIQDKKLLLANSEQAIRETLTHLLEKNPNVFEKPDNKTYLAKLPRSRQGTFILNNTALSAHALSAAPGGQIARLGAGGIGAMGKTIPLTVGAIRVRDDGQVNIQFLTPLMLSQLPDASFRQSLQGIYRETEAFDQARQLPSDTAVMIGATGVDRFYDFYREYLINPEASTMLKLADFYLSSFRLELRRDIVSLLKDRTVVASRGDKSFMLLLDKSLEKDKTLDKLSSLLSTGAFPLKQQTEQVGDVSIKTLSVMDAVPNRLTSQISYGTLSGRGGSAIAFASPADYQELLAVRGNDRKNLADTPEYKTLMDGLPTQSNLIVYMNLKAPGKAETGAGQPDWMEAMGLSLKATPYKPGEIDLLEGYLNLKLRPASHSS